MYEQKPYPVLFSCWHKSYSGWREHSLKQILLGFACAREARDTHKSLRPHGSCGSYNLSYNVFVNDQVYMNK